MRGWQRGIYWENGCLLEHVRSGGGKPLRITESNDSLPEDCLRGTEGENCHRRYPLCRVLEDRFQRKSESIVPDVTNGIPPPTAKPVGITSGDDQVVSRSEFYIVADGHLRDLFFFRV